MAAACRSPRATCKRRVGGRRFKSATNLSARCFERRVQRGSIEKCHAIRSDRNDALPAHAADEPQLGDGRVVRNSLSKHEHAALSINQQLAIRQANENRDRVDSRDGGSTRGGERQREQRADKSRL